MSPVCKILNVVPEKPDKTVQLLRMSKINKTKVLLKTSQVEKVRAGHSNNLDIGDVPLSAVRYSRLMINWV